MTGSEEKVWTWEMMEPGLAAPQVIVQVTKESIANYARSIMSSNPVFFDDDAARAEGYQGVVAPPTMCFAYAPMNRWELFSARGYIAPQDSKVNRRATPFVGAEVFPQPVPVYPGDTVTSVTTLDRAWVSSTGNKFVSFRIVGHNQRGERVAEYLYNIIWEYARGQKRREATPAGTSQHA